MFKLGPGDFTVQCEFSCSMPFRSLIVITFRGYISIEIRGNY